MTKEDFEFYEKVEQNNFVLCDKLLRELLDRKYKRAYTLQKLLAMSQQNVVKQDCKDHKR